MNKKNTFRRSLLSSAIFAASLQGVAVSSQAIELVNSPVSGSITNAGSITSGNTGIVITTPGFIGSTISGTDGIYLDRQNDWALVRNTLPEFGNGGPLGIDESLILDDSLIISDNPLDVHHTIDHVSLDYGLYLDSVMFNGSFINEASIDAVDSSLYVKQSEIVGAIINRGWLDSSEAAGIAIEHSTIEGGVDNENTITVGMGSPAVPDALPVTSPLAGISVRANSETGAVNNSGSITAQAGIEHNSPAFREGITANGIEVINGAIVTEITNSGDITADTFGILVDGTGNEGLTVSGAIHNTDTGSIQSGDNGIYIRHAGVGSNVVNDGAIQSMNDNAMDIEDSHIGGSVVNTGTATSHDSYDGIDIDDTTVEYHVYNSGTITGEDAFDIDDSLVKGSVVNTGTLNAAESGMDIDQSDIGGELVNAGQIVAGETGIEVFGEKLKPEGDGEAIIDYTTIGSHVVNAGSIVAAENGIVMEYVEIAGHLDTFHEGNGSIIAGPQGGDPDVVNGYEGIELDYVNIGGNVVLGDISASGYGIDFESTDIAGDLTSKGTVTATRNDALYLYRSSVGGNVVNEGQLTAGREGINFDDTTVGGSFRNSGTINSGGPGIYFSRVDIGGNFLNEGDITAEDDAGILFLIDNNVAGEFRNTGHITSDNDRGIDLQGRADYEDGELIVHRELSIGGAFVDTGTIDSGHDGIFLSDINIGSALLHEDNTPAPVAVLNTGDVTSAYGTAITIDGHSTINGSVVNEGNLIGVSGLGLFGDAKLKITEQEGVDSLRELEVKEALMVNGNVENYGNITAESNGLELRGMQLNGSLFNSGDITTINDDGSNAIKVSESIVTGNIENSGVLTVTEKYSGDGIDLDGMTLEGSLINRGAMSINGSEGIHLENVRVVGDVINEESASLTVRSDGFYFENAHIKGDVINKATIVALENDGIEFDVDGPSDYRKTPSYIEGRVLNTGNITAGDIGIEMDGEHNSERHNEGPDGETSVTWFTQHVTIGGALINEGDIDAHDSGIELKHAAIGEKGVREEGQADVKNTGAITAGHGSGISIEGSQFGGDIINTGDITANAGDYYYRGDHYAVGSGESHLPDGGLVLTALGYDDTGDAWFSIKNTGADWEDVNLIEEGSLFEIDELGGLHEGEEVIINAGQLSDGANVLLTQDGVGVITAGMTDSSQSFTPEYNTAAKYDDHHEMVQRGITITSRVFDEGNEEEKSPVPTYIAGSLLNSSTIHSRHEGIYLNDIELGENVNNAGNIASDWASAIAVSATTINGRFINQGDVQAGVGQYKEGDIYSRRWEGTPTAEGELVLSSQGADSNGNQWYLIRNESNSGHRVRLSDDSGSFALRDITLEPGEEIYVNAGSTTESVAIQKGDWVAEASPAGTVFTPDYGERTGITLVGTTIEGDVYNTGAINAPDHGIAIEDSEVGATLETDSDGNTTDVYAGVRNEGDITSGETGIYLSNVTLTHTVADGEAVDFGDVVNTGTINAGENGIMLDGVTGAGTVANTGTINADYVGLWLYEAHGLTSVVNEGTLTGDMGMAIGESSLTQAIVNAEGAVIDAWYDGMTVYSVSADRVVNAGNINAEYHNGISLYDTQLSGVIVNSAEGVVSAGTHGIHSSGGHSGSVVNAGTVNAGTRLLENPGLGPDQFGHGITIEDNTLVADSNGAPAVVINDEGAVINAATYGIRLQAVDGAALLANMGTITAGKHGMWANMSDTHLVMNSGTITSGLDGIHLLNLTVSVADIDGDEQPDTDTTGHIINTESGVIDASDDGIRLSSTTVEGIVMNAGHITAAENAIDIDKGILTQGFINTGTLNAVDAAIDIAGQDVDGVSSVASILNSGTIASSGNAALRVAEASVGGVINTGTITGGTVAEAVDSGLSGRGITANTQVAIDYRDSTSALALANGLIGVIDNAVAINTGDITGAIYGSHAENGDDIIELSAGTLTGDVYDVEQVNVFGTFTLNNSLFSLNDTASLHVVGETVIDADAGLSTTGNLAMGVANAVTVEGDYLQEGVLTVIVDKNAGNLDQVRVDVNTDEVDPSPEVTTGSATLADTAVVSVNIKDDFIGNINTDTTTDVYLVNADKGVVNNGATVQSDTLLVSYSTFNRNDGTEFGSDFGVTGTVNSLGVLADAGGADTNAANAIAALQGIDSAGLIALYEANRDLYDQIYDGTETSLAALANQLVASPETGIAAGQVAQTEAVNTILTRIAELRSGASGISAGDDDEASTVRPDALWIRAIYSDGEQDATRHNGSDFNAYSLRSKGFTLGADKDVSDTLTLGAGVTLANSTANEKGGGQGANSETQTVLGSVYAGWRDQDYFVDTSINLGKGSTDLKSTQWEADYDSTQVGVSVLAGKSILFNNNDTLVEPRVGFNYTRLETDEYSYTGTAGKETVGAQNLETLELGAGVRFITGIEVGDGLLLPEASLMAWHDFKADAVKANVEFETGGGSFTYFGPEAEKTRYQAGIGAEYLMDNNFSVSVNYEHNWQDGFKADTVVAKLRYDF